jgi:glycosyltransferase involved in cell wall biosynthesis
MTGDIRRVTFVVTRLNIGGVTRQIHLLNAALASHGFQPTVVFGREGFREGRIDLDGPNARGLPAFVRGPRPLKDASTYREIGRMLRDQRPSVVHTHLAKAGTLGRIAAKRARVPVVVHTFHGHVLRGYFPPFISRAFLEVERTLARRTDALIAVSESVRDDLLSLGIGTPPKWRVIPVGVELDAFMGELPDATSARADLALPVVGPLVGIVGRLAPVKDLDTFLAAAALIGHKRPDVSFVVAGDGELRGSVEQRARELLGDRVRFLGWVEDLPKLYAALDVVVLTSRNEGTPMSLIEAGAAGRPVVATAVGGVPEVVQDGRTGWLVPGGDADAVAARVLELVEDPGSARAFSEAARKLVVVRFSAARMVADHATLYEELLERRGLSRDGR